jgi:rare lipoprotein A
MLASQQMPRALVVILAALVLLSACHKKRAAKIPPAPAPAQALVAPPVAISPPAGEAAGEVGLASWYGHPYHGRASASGEIYDMEQMTAAHRTLPFGAQVRVYDLDNQKSVDVRINDRGPFVDGRVIDLSHAAARAIDMIGPGTARVRLEILNTPAAPDMARFAVQVGAFRNRDNADRLRREMEAKYGRARLVQRADTPGLWRVLVGLEPTQDGASGLAGRIRSEHASITSAFVVRVDSL